MSQHLASGYLRAWKIWSSLRWLPPGSSYSKLLVGVKRRRLPSPCDWTRCWPRSHLGHPNSNRSRPTSIRSFHNHHLHHCLLMHSSPVNVHHRDQLGQGRQRMLSRSLSLDLPDAQLLAPKDITWAHASHAPSSIRRAAPVVCRASSATCVVPVRNRGGGETHGRETHRQGTCIRKRSVQGSNIRGEIDHKSQSI